MRAGEAVMAFIVASVPDAVHPPPSPVRRGRVGWGYVTLDVGPIGAAVRSIMLINPTRASHWRTTMDRGHKRRDETTAQRRGRRPGRRDPAVQERGKPHPWPTTSPSPSPAGTS